ncbi:RHS repeat-associated core domain-containing protein, partial [Escherichia coli]|uniref:RHS repeat-associated core domain-containing protein n=1 Tax=Escherichia coli TaxID=562 RepID=UPI0035A678D1
QWQYDEHGWLTTLSHTSEGHRVSVHYGYDDKGRLTGERQTVENPETGELLWQHETKHAYNEQGLANRVTPDSLPPVEWLTYGSGYLAGMKLGGTPLVEYTRDRLHRETARSFGGAGSTAGYEQATAYTLTGQLQSRHLNLPQLDRDYTWNDNGQLVRISGPQECREYRYSGTGRLTGVHTTAANLDINIPYATDPAGNRLPDPELHPDSTLTAWPDNRIAEDAHYVYRHDEYGRLAEKTDRISEGVIRMHDERTHHYHYDSQHRLVFYTRIQHGEPQVESRYLYDPLGRRTGKRVWRRERDLTGWMSLSRKPEETWYGWDGDRLTTVQTQQTRIQTVYQPGSFTPLLRIETENGEQAKARHRSLAEVLQEDTGVTLPAELAVMLGRLERELRQGSVSEESQQWLAQCGLTAEQMAAQLEAEYIPERKLHLYHCDHRGLPQALISPEGETAWQGEYDEWGNLLGETSAQHLQQPYRLPGQQYDEESGLYYNRHRYYDPLQGRYITQDPIDIKGGWNLYSYALNPVSWIDPLGLTQCDSEGCNNDILFTGGSGPDNKILNELGPRDGIDGLGSQNMKMYSGLLGGDILKPGILGGLTLGSVTQRPSRTAEEEVQAQIEYLAYKKRCEQKPDSNLSRCAAAIFQKSRKEDCLRMRQEWDDKWWPGKHADEIKNVKASLKNTLIDVKKRCMPTSGIPR